MSFSSEDGNRFWDSLTKIVTAIFVAGGIWVGVWQYKHQVEHSAMKPIQDKRFKMYEKISNLSRKLIGEEHPLVFKNTGDALRQIYLTEFVVFGDENTNLALAKLIIHARDVGKKKISGKEKTTNYVKGLNQCIRYSFTQTWDWTFEDLVSGDSAITLNMVDKCYG